MKRYIEEEETLNARLIYVTLPTDEQRRGILGFLRKEYPDHKIELSLEEDESIKSGFILRVGKREYDWSEQGRIQQLKDRLNAAAAIAPRDLNAAGIISMMREGVDAFSLSAEDAEVMSAHYHDAMEALLA